MRVDLPMQCSLYPIPNRKGDIEIVKRRNEALQFLAAGGQICFRNHSRHGGSLFMVRPIYGKIEIGASLILKKLLALEKKI